MKNKRGLLRIIEAFVAIILVLGVLLYFLSVNADNRQELLGEKIHDIERNILLDVSQNDELRNEILSTNITDKGTSEYKTMIDSLRDFITPNIPEGFNFAINVCTLKETCGLLVAHPGEDFEIYSDSIPITANLDIYDPKKLKIWMWKNN